MYRLSLRLSLYKHTYEQFTILEVMWNVKCQCIHIFAKLERATAFFILLTETNLHVIYRKLS